MDGEVAVIEELSCDSEDGDYPYLLCGAAYGETRSVFLDDIYSLARSMGANARQAFYVR